MKDKIMGEESGGVTGAMNNMVDKAKETFGFGGPDKKAGFFSNNKGLLIGSVVALFAWFGMESSFLSVMLAGVAVLGGVLADRDTGIFSGFLGKNEPSSGNGKAKEPETRSQENSKESSFNISPLPTPGRGTGTGHGIQ